MNKKLITIAIAAVLGVVLLLLLFTFQVRQSEVVVVSTFLKPTDTITNAGLYVKWPWPVQSVNRFDKRVQTFEDKFSEFTLADKSILLASVYIGWRISDAQAFYPKFPGGSIDSAQRQLEGLLRDAKIQVMGKYSLADFVNADPSQIKFGEIEKLIEGTVKAELAKNNYGITIDFLGFKRIGLPEGTTQSVFERMKAERTTYIDKARQDGESQASIIKSDADLQAAKLLANAQAAATRIEGEGQAEAAKTLAVFQQNPDLAVFLLELEALKNSVNQKTTLIIDEDKPPFDLFKKLSDANPGK